MQSRAAFSVPFAMMVCCAAVFAQSAPKPSSPATSTAAPAAQNGAATAQTSQVAPGQVPTVKASAQLVVLDVVVTDSAHRPVHGLAAQDFTITEDGAPQVAKSFEEHTSLSAADAVKLPAIPKLPPGIFTNYTPAPPNGAVNVVLLDTLNTPMLDQSYVRQQLMTYLKTLQPGARIAIFGLTTRLVLLQGFTSDPEMLKTVLTKVNSKGSPLLDDQVGGGGTQNSMGDTMEDAGVDAEIVANVRDFEAVTQSFQLQLRAKYTLDAMNQLARYLSMIPGRKNLIWFSGSFPISILPDTSGMQANPFIAVASSEDEFRDTVRLMAKSQVAVYPVDARGLFMSPMYSVQTTRNYGGRNGVARMQQDNTKFFTQTAQEHGTMQEMADATGGRAFVNTNGLAQAVASAIDEGSNFYTLSYTPANSEQNGKLRKIKVKLDKPGVKLAYRQGYYADRPGAAETPAAPMNAATTTGQQMGRQDALRLAMMRGAPVPTEILMEVGVVPMTPAGQTEDAVAKLNIASEKMKGPYRRYSVNYAINAPDVNFVRTPDGIVHGDMDLIIFVYTGQGEIVNTLHDEIHIAAPLDQVRKAVNQGLIWHEEVSAPVKGEYFLRIAVRDQHRDRYGAVEMAASKVRNLVPTPATTAMPAIDTLLFRPI